MNQKYTVEPREAERKVIQAIDRLAESFDRLAIQVGKTAALIVKLKEEREQGAENNEKARHGI